MLVISIAIEGRRCRDMYDEHPGLAYFYVDGCRDIPVPEPLSIEAAQPVGQAEFERLSAEASSEEGEFDGLFVPRRLVLRGQDGAILQCYEDGAWAKDFDPPDTWPDLLAKANELDSQGSVESGWDNFCTAQGLWASAANLRRRVALAQAHFGTQPSPPTA